MNALKKLTTLLLFAFATPALAVTDDQVFAYAEATYFGIFSGMPMAGQYQQYNYRYYPASGNYLAVDTSGMISILGPYTGNVITAVGPVTNFAGSVTAWEAVAMPYTITAQDVSGNCTLDTMSFAGFLTPTGQASTYTTVFPNGAAMTMTVPGSISFDYSYAEGSGMTSDHMQVTFDSQTRSISGSISWMHTNGCMGYTTLSGSW